MQKSQRKKTSAGRLARAAAPQQVRIIGGQWKRTPLAVLDAEGLRPTPDRVRETVFNWLTHLVDGNWSQLTCLDMFAGSGALGFEAASRGAAEVVMLEQQPAAVRQLQAVKDKLGALQVSIVRADAFAKAQQWISASDSGQGAFDVIFLDPPYHQDWLMRLLPLAARLLRPGGIVYAEAEMPLVDSQEDWLAHWEVVRSDRAGLVFYHLLQYKNTLKNQA